MAEWQDAMSSHEFAEWLAFRRIQPFGEWRDDWRMATLAAVITNAITRSKDTDPIREAKDFMPDFEKALDEMEAQEEISEQERVMHKIKSVFGGLAAASRKKAARPPSPK